MNWKSPVESCQHHLKELVSIKKILNNDTLVVVDDSPIICYLQQSIKIEKVKTYFPLGQYQAQQFLVKDL